jgi:hypothetical protein
MTPINATSISERSRFVNIFLFSYNFVEAGYDPGICEVRLFSSRTCNSLLGGRQTERRRLELRSLRERFGQLLCLSLDGA